MQVLYHMSVAQPLLGVRLSSDIEPSVCIMRSGAAKRRHSLLGAVSTMIIRGRRHTGINLISPMVSICHQRHSACARDARSAVAAQDC